MASELRVNTLKDAAGNNSVATSVVFNGTAKAWVNFNGTGTIAIRDSYNVSSLNDDGTGKYDVVLASSMTDGNYAGIGIGAASTSDTDGETTGQCRRIAPTSSLFGVRGNQVATSAASDIELVYGIAHGDLA